MTSNEVSQPRSSEAGAGTALDFEMVAKDIIRLQSRFRQILAQHVQGPQRFSFIQDILLYGDTHRKVVDRSSIPESYNTGFGVAQMALLSKELYFTYQADIQRFIDDRSLSYEQAENLPFFLSN